ncbi:putative UPF0481 protein [Ananas comosus]|uniref:Putative UPF0481 protein n=1 Tax=Ananas comosus TaxID=4615 RepID=A0A199V0B9_ANACO|nr:putative UPF0481 protein [Ananas comosus]
MEGLEEARIDIPQSLVLARHIQRPLSDAARIDIPQSLVLARHIQRPSSDELTAADKKFTFFRVPALIRERNKELYEPRMVAIGPYGCRDEPSLRETEWLKQRYLQSFRSRSGDSRINYYKAKIRELEPKARRCYFEPVKLNAKKFVEMLLLDGCFILEFLIKWYQGNKDDLFAADWSLPLIRDDLLLLENQIPLFVLDELFELVTPTLDSEIPSTLMELLVKFLKSINLESPEEDIESTEEEVQGNHDRRLRAPREAKDFGHLLHLYYHCYVTKPQTNPTGRTIGGTILKWLWPCRIFALLPSCITLLLSCIRLKICRSQEPAKKRFPRTIPSATELVEAGVRIKKKTKKNEKKNEKKKEEEKKKKEKKKEEEENQNQNQRRLSAFLDVAFHNGVLEIPFLSVEPSTLPRFSNLVAFEQCSRCKPKEAYMTSYAVFMDCLINTGEDVAILHKLGILENNLASDEDLAAFFNQLADCATLDPENHYLVELFRGVRKYCSSPWPSWRTKLVRDYFSNPWAILSLFAAAVLLILTILQTVYTIYPYYHPGN